jgi:hypothetical protein
LLFCYRCGENVEGKSTCPKCHSPLYQPEVVVNAKLALYNDLRTEIRDSLTLRTQILGILVALESGLFVAGLAYDRIAFLLISPTIGLLGWLVLSSYRIFFELSAVVRGICDLGWETYTREPIVKYKNKEQAIVPSVGKQPCLIVLLTFLSALFTPLLFTVAQNPTDHRFSNVLAVVIMMFATAIISVILLRLQTDVLDQTKEAFNRDLSKDEKVLKFYDKALLDFLLKEPEYALELEKK